MNEETIEEKISKLIDDTQYLPDTDYGMCMELFEEKKGVKVTLSFKKEEYRRKPVGFYMQIESDEFSDENNNVTFEFDNTGKIILMTAYSVDEGQHYLIW